MASIISLDLRRCIKFKNKTGKYEERLLVTMSKGSKVELHCKRDQQMRRKLPRQNRSVRRKTEA